MPYPTEAPKVCRHGHGPLKAVDWKAGDAKGEIPSFALPVEPPLPGNVPDGVYFRLRVYVCPQCGYLEFYDE